MDTVHAWLKDDMSVKETKKKKQVNVNAMLSPPDTAGMKK